ncbi:1-deoxy-D-xylulose-5-phosphate synthase N-terminal domain-containing protein [Pseudostreptobacillus hongkongensis]|uniref:1-deoxy-D-xylulose-5-phosphate synthase N-terminal domain-containing protein n=1 Tax=Pseudostreptobacillus hongkongensis TaxID=1162717 RepID=UPI000834BC3F|nr:1-deoxy-D-xylulose-5-phosphate synthase N-terminal domain-containing protein [Pseudostreptobacillus hongkongensis]
MKILAQEIRDVVIIRDSKYGGHFGPNLGIVETTIALHYVFESPKDKFVFDVSHQTYPHKMLTGRKIAILGLGTFYHLAEKVADLYKEKTGIDITVVNSMYITGIDTDLMEDLRMNHGIIVTLEDGILNGGFGEKIASYFGNSSITVLNYGLKKEFIDRYNIKEVLKDNRLDEDLILEDLLEY